MKNHLFILLFIPIIGNAQLTEFPILPDSSSPKTTIEKDDLPPTFFAKNRQALRQLMPDNSVAILFSSPVRTRSNDIEYEYHQDPNFYYLTGHTEPHSVLLIFKEQQLFEDFKTDEMIFVREKKERDEIWTGKILGAEAAVKELGIQTAFIGEDFFTTSFNLKEFDHILHMGIPEDVRNTPEKADLAGLIQSFKLKSQHLESLDHVELPEYMARLRQIKSAEEIKLLKKAIDITCNAQIELMRALNPEMTEYQSEAIIEYIFKREGAEHAGFPSIVGGGENSCILHYVDNRKQLEGSDMLVIDVGAEYKGYTADITRSLPVDGHFSEEEKIIYNLVLKAQEAGIEACQVGNKFWEPHTVATKIITDGLLELGIITKYYHVQRYFMHGTSHYLGLDVHDAGLNGPLEAGNVITVEPGIYIPEGSDCDPKWWNIGIRIEDDILITTQGPENMSAKAPRTIEEIEALMSLDGNF